MQQSLRVNSDYIICSMITIANKTFTSDVSLASMLEVKPKADMAEKGVKAPSA